MLGSRPAVDDDRRTVVALIAVATEAATAALWVASVLRFDELEEAAFAALASTVLLALAAIDLEHRRLPNVIVLPSTAAGAVLALFVGPAPVRAWLGL